MAYRRKRRRGYRPRRRKGRSRRSRNRIYSKYGAARGGVRM